jgi:CDP-glucose 4,6-dehydratase
MNYNIFKKKKIIVTGHTGFKGSWLFTWLDKLGADIVGISKSIPTHPSHYETLSLKKNSFWIDIRDKKKLKKKILSFQPDFIFHLAAQSLVFESIKNPIDTWNTNLIGTLNVLESLRDYKKKCSVVLVTSDKCYENLEIKRGYLENDKLGGSDPYSASKASTEIMIKSYVKTFFNNQTNVRIATARAGNVIGGGDWSNSRIIPDCVKSWTKNKTMIVRSPNSTRPWQHVLEPLRGYLILAKNLYQSKEFHGTSFNFGPNKNMKKKRVIEVVKYFSNFWKNSKWKVITPKKSIESKLLSLNCYKAKKKLGWTTILSSDEALKLTSDWYNNFYSKKKINNFSYKQIFSYEKKIK